jgi:uncharacterized protein YcbK (DUF882 family)
MHPAPPRPTKTTLRNRYPAVPLFGAHVGETLGYRPFDERGRDRREAERALQRLLRSRQTGAQHRLHPRLGAVLYEIGRHFAGHRIEIFSGYRPRAYCDRAHSRHINGSAVDFRVEGIDNEELIAYLEKTFHPAGVGFYPHDVHVHLDVDRRVDTYWTDPGPPSSDPMLAVPANEPALVDVPRLAEAEVEPPPAANLGEPPTDDPAIPSAEDASPDETTDEPTAEPPGDGLTNR